MLIGGVINDFLQPSIDFVHLGLHGENIDKAQFFGHRGRFDKGSITVFLIAGRFGVRFAVTAASVARFLISRVDDALIEGGCINSTEFGSNRAIARGV